LTVPLVVTAHGTDVRFLEDGQPPRVQAAMLGACAAAARVLAVSRDLAARLADCGVPGERIEVIPMGVDAERFRPLDRDEARRVLGLASDATIVLFVGRVTEEKGVLVLGEALRSLPGVDAVAAGPVEIDVPGLRPLGVVSSDGLVRWLAAADVVCLPSFSEGMPVAVAEALAAGRPVVGTTVGGIPEQIIEGRNGLLVPPRDPAALAEALRTALAMAWSPEEIRATSEPFWWSAIADRIARIYDEVLAG
jgi:glycosyltransferase involved in cell wall biosynthesis